MASQYFQTPDGAAVLQSAIDGGLVAPNSTSFNFNMVNLTLAAEHGAFDQLGYAGIDALTFAKLWFPFIFIGFGCWRVFFPSTTGVQMATWPRQLLSR